MIKKIALITGGSRGIGAEIAKKLASIGYHCIVNFKVNKDLAINVVEEIEKCGGSAEIYGCDVSNPQEVEKMFNYIKMAYGKIDVLVNNAGISIAKAFQDVTDSEWREILDCNLSSVFYCSREAVKLMLKRASDCDYNLRSCEYCEKSENAETSKNVEGRESESSGVIGKIINISSMWGLVGGSYEVHYSATKAGIIGMTKALAKEVAPSGILVNAIAPGAISTDMMKMLGEEAMQYLIDEIPLSKIGKPSDIAEMVAFLVQRSGDYITGQVFSINGGLVI